MGNFARKKKKVLPLLITSAFAFTILFGNVSIEAKNSPGNSSIRKTQASNGESYVRQVPEVSVNKIGNSKLFKNTPKTNEFKPGELIIKFKPAAKSDAEAKNTLASMLGKDASVVSVENLGYTNAKLVKFAGGKSPVDISANLLKLYKDQIEYVEPNYIVHVSDIDTSWVPSDPDYGKLWGLKNTGQDINGTPGTPGIDINAEKAWDVTKGSSTVVVGVIDTGVDITHDDLKKNIWVNTKEIAGNGIDDDNNGFVDDVNGWDFITNSGTITDPYGHGTHCSGTIAASADSTGVVGVAPNVKIMSIRFLDSSGSGTWADAVKAVNYAAIMGVKITSNSWGGYYADEALYDAVKSFPGLFIAAAGNGYWNNNDTYPHYPSSFDLDNVLAVAAINNSGQLAYFSNYGPTSVDVAAPGQDVYSTIPGNQYAYYSGTSMATPHVSGTAALVLSNNSGFNTATLKSAIMKNVVKLSSLDGLIVTGGLINAGTAVVNGSDNDIPGKVLPKSPVSGYLNYYSDIDDVYAVKLTRGTVLNLSLTGAAGTDFDLYLYDKDAKTVKSNQKILAYSEKAGTSTESIIYNIPADGTYYIDVYDYSGTGNYTLTYKFGLGKGVYENTSKLLTYDGTWETITDSNSSGGSYAMTNTDGSAVSIRFSGTGITLTGVLNNSQGIAKITIDGVSKNVDLYSATALYKQTIFTKTGLKAGIHNVKVEWTGLVSRKARKGTTTTNVNIDKVTIN